MERASSLIYPGSRILAGWWRQLQHYQPQVIQVGYVHVHRLEALVRTTRSQPLDPFTQILLQSLTLKSSGSANADQGTLAGELCQRLHLPAAVLGQFLIGIQKNGLIERSSTGGWVISELGHQARTAHRYPVQVQERRCFSFLERLSPLGERSGLPEYVPIADCVAVSWHVDESLSFQLPWLQACLVQPEDWKHLHGFPQEIQALVADASVPAWQQVVVDRPERLFLVQILGGTASAPEWMGFAVRADGWILHDQTPILRLPAAARGTGVGSDNAPSGQVWQEGWRSWCRERQLPLNEVESCVLSYQPPRLTVQAPGRFVQRLHAANSDVLQGEAWLLLGGGYLRSALLLALTPVA